MFIGLHVKYTLFLLNCNKIEFSLQSVEKYSNTELYENPASGTGVVPCGRTDRQACMTKLTVTFRNFANAPETN